MDNTVLYRNPISTPLASEKFSRKLLRFVKKSSLFPYLDMGSKIVKRGVKEVGKAIRKGDKGVVVLAADVSPVDVISHIPIQCENQNIPYIYVPSRASLGVASQTKKPTSVVLIVGDKKKSGEKFQKIFEKMEEMNPFK